MQINCIVIESIIIPLYCISCPEVSPDILKLPQHPVWAVPALLHRMWDGIIQPLSKLYGVCHDAVHITESDLFCSSLYLFFLLSLHVYNPDIPWVQQTVEFTPWYSTHSLLFTNLISSGEFSTVSGAIANHYSGAFTVPSGTHNCWMDPGSMEWNLPTHYLLHMMSSGNQPLSHTLSWDWECIIILEFIILSH